MVETRLTLVLILCNVFTTSVKQLYYAINPCEQLVLLCYQI